MTPAEMMNLINERKRRRPRTEETSTPAAAPADDYKAPAEEKDIPQFFAESEQPEAAPPEATPADYHPALSADARAIIDDEDAKLALERFNQVRWVWLRRRAAELQAEGTCPDPAAAAADEFLREHSDRIEREIHAEVFEPKAPAPTCDDCGSDLSPNGRCDPCALLRFVTGAPIGKRFTLPEHWNARELITEQAQHRVDQAGRRVQFVLRGKVLHIERRP